MNNQTPNTDAARAEIADTRAALPKSKPGRKAGKPTRTFSRRVPASVYSTIKRLSDAYIDELLRRPYRE